VSVALICAGGLGGGCSPSASFAYGGSDYTAFRVPYGSCDEMDGYAVATAADCPGVTCPADYFAVCDGKQWVGCDCERSDLGSLGVIADPSFAGAPGSTDAGEGGAGSRSEGGSRAPRDAGKPSGDR
jgi:hypothetical protein